MTSDNVPVGSSDTAGSRSRLESAAGQQLQRPVGFGKVMPGLAIVCFVLAAADFVLHRDSYFNLEGTRGFYALAGLAGCGVLVAAGHLLRTLVMRPENYYDE